MSCRTGVVECDIGCVVNVVCSVSLLSETHPWYYVYCILLCVPAQSCLLRPMLLLHIGAAVYVSSLWKILDEPFFQL